MVYFGCYAAVRTVGSGGQLPFGGTFYPRSFGKRGGWYMVTFELLFQYTLVILTIVALMSNKK